MTEQQSTKQTPNSKTFNPHEHLIQLKSKDGPKDYLPVNWRMVWFREHFPHGTIDTQEVIVDLDREVEEDVFVWNSEKRRSEKITKHGRGYAMFKATVTDGEGGRATGYGTETAAGFPDFVEKAETRAIGRALSALGFGTQFAPEDEELPHVADSPVVLNQGAAGAAPTGNGSRTNTNPGSGGRAQQNNAGTTGNGSRPSAPSESASPETITEQQMASIRKLSEHLNKAVPETLAKYSFINARKLIQQLTAEYREAKQRKAS
jgi:hypothetical protein